MANTDELSIYRRQLVVGRVRKKLEAGYSVEEIRKALGIPESQARAIVKMCEEADGKKSERYADNNVEE